MPKPRKKPGSRKLEKRLIIICEGMADKSESAYFKAFIRSCSFAGNKVDVRVIDTRKNTGKELVREAKNSREFSHDIAWVVYDKDGYTRHPETFETARQCNVKIGFSSISFEMWILFHFEYTNKAFIKSEDIIKYLKDKSYIDYTKGDIDTFSKTNNLLNTAKKNAIRIQKYQKNSNPIGIPIYEFNPYTDLNELISDIEELQEYK